MFGLFVFQFDMILGLDLFLFFLQLFLKFWDLFKKLHFLLLVLLLQFFWWFFKVLHLFFECRFLSLKHLNSHLEFGGILRELIFFIFDFGSQIIQFVDGGIDSSDFEWELIIIEVDPGHVEITGGDIEHTDNKEWLTSWMHQDFRRMRHSQMWFQQRHWGQDTGSAV